MTGKPVRVIPRIAVKGIAALGELMTRAGFRFPITLSRFDSMTHDYPTPMERTFEVLGPPPLTLEEGIDETVRWLDSYDPGEGTTS
jgi:hypothetical protein